MNKQDKIYSNQHINPKLCNVLAVLFSRCQKYLSLPAGCILTKDPSNPCCKVPNCDSPTLAPNLTPIAPTPALPGGPTLQPQLPTQAPQPKGEFC